MKRSLRILALAVLSALLAGCGGVSESGGQRVELFAANVGKGDALLLRVDGWVGLIDAGKARARGRVLSAMRHMGVSALDAVFLTHTDDDHAEGLAWLAESDIPVGQWYAPALFTGVKAKKHPAARAAAARGQSVGWLRRGDSIPLGDTGASLRVLAPARLFEDKDDNNSLVLLLETAQGRMLLTGDMELPEEAELLATGDDLRCDVLKAPNHGDDDTVSQAFAQAASAHTVVISTDSDEKPGTPDPGVVSRLAAAGGTVYVTQDAELGLHITLTGGAAEVTPVDIDAAALTGVTVARVTPGDDLIALQNAGADCDLTGCYLYSERGNELFAFPEGFTLKSGETVTVGTKTSDAGSYDLLWNDKKVIHPSKSDAIVLYDAWGRAVDRRESGM